MCASDSACSLTLQNTARCKPFMPQGRGRLWRLPPSCCSFQRHAIRGHFYNPTRFSLRTREVHLLSRSLYIPTFPPFFLAPDFLRLGCLAPFVRRQRAVQARDLSDYHHAHEGGLLDTTSSRLCTTTSGTQKGLGLPFSIVTGGRHMHNKSVAQ